VARWKEGFLRAQRVRPEEAAVRESDVMSSRLYVGNLPFTVGADALREAFAASGEVTDVHVVNDRETGRSRGFAFVTMGNAHEATVAIGAMNGAMLEGRALRVNEAEERPQGGGGGSKGGARNRW
jgi:RNA recognition motif-containing protein